MYPRAASERGWKGAIYPNQKHKQPGLGKKKWKKVQQAKKERGKKKKKRKHGAKRLKHNPSTINTFNTIGLRQLCAILHQCRRNLIPTRITRRQAEVNVCARDIVCVELYSHTQPRATSHKYTVCFLSQNQVQKQSNSPHISKPAGGRARGGGRGRRKSG